MQRPDEALEKLNSIAKAFKIDGNAYYTMAPESFYLINKWIEHLEKNNPTNKLQETLEKNNTALDSINDMLKMIVYPEVTLRAGNEIFGITPEEIAGKLKTHGEILKNDPEIAKLAAARSGKTITSLAQENPQAAEKVTSDESQPEFTYGIADYPDSKYYGVVKYKYQEKINMIATFYYGENGLDKNQARELARELAEEMNAK